MCTTEGGETEPVLRPGNFVGVWEEGGEGGGSGAGTEEADDGRRKELGSRPVTSLHVTFRLLRRRPATAGHGVTTHCLGREVLGGSLDGGG